MGTTFEQLECQAMTYIKNDLSLDWDLKNRLPVFYRRMWNYMLAALPLFNKPPTMLARLHSYTEPQYSDVLYRVEDEPVNGQITVSGIPDIICCCKGRFLGLEVKLPNGKLTELQKRAIEKINRAGGIACRVESVEEVKAVIDRIEGEIHS